jgi:hypothetical protein
MKNIKVNGSSNPEGEQVPIQINRTVRSLNLDCLGRMVEQLTTLSKNDFKTVVKVAKMRRIGDKFYNRSYTQLRGSGV